MSDPTPQQIIAFLMSCGLVCVPRGAMQGQPTTWQPPNGGGGGGASFTGVQAGTYQIGGGSIRVNGRGQILEIVPGGGGGGAVNMVFGRTGDVVAQAGDYAAFQVSATGPFVAGSVQAQLDASAIAISGRAAASSSFITSTAEPSLPTARVLTNSPSVSWSFGSGIVQATVPGASTGAPGIVQLALDGESVSGIAVQANDSRLSNARTPTSQRVERHRRQRCHDVGHHPAECGWHGHRSICQRDIVVGDHCTGRRRRPLHADCLANPDVEVDVVQRLHATLHCTYGTSSRSTIIRSLQPAPHERPLQHATRGFHTRGGWRRRFTRRSVPAYDSRRLSISSGLVIGLPGQG